MGGHWQVVYYKPAVPGNFSLNLQDSSWYQDLLAHAMVSTTLISSVPQYVSAEEHRNIVASTPTSFNDILPVLRHREDNVRVMLDPPLPTFTEQDGANGTLFVIER